MQCHRWRCRPRARRARPLAAAWWPAPCSPECPRSRGWSPLQLSLPYGGAIVEHAQEPDLLDRFAQVAVDSLGQVARVRTGHHDDADRARRGIALELAQDVESVGSLEGDVDQDRGRL